MFLRISCQFTEKCSPPKKIKYRHRIFTLTDLGYVMIPILSSVLVFRKFSLSRLEAGDRSSLRATEGRRGEGSRINTFF